MGWSWKRGSLEKREGKKNEREKSTRKRLNEFKDLPMKAFDSQTWIPPEGSLPLWSAEHGSPLQPVKYKVSWTCILSANGCCRSKCVLHACMHKTTHSVQDIMNTLNARLIENKSPDLKRISREFKIQILHLGVFLSPPLILKHALAGKPCRAPIVSLNQFTFSWVNENWFRRKTS